MVLMLVDMLCRLVNGWIWDKRSSDPRYVAPFSVQWEDVYKAVKNVNLGENKLKVGLLNFNRTEFGSWTQMLPESEFSVIRLEHANESITWQTLYPEWIDEEEETEIPTCPSLPDPIFPRDPQFDVVAVKLPCTRVAGWSRDVARLHLQLSAAKLGVASRRGNSAVHVLFVTECFPIPNLFACKNLVKREGNAWLYKPDSNVLKEKLRLPVGSCELAVPLNAKSKLITFLQFLVASHLKTLLHSGISNALSSINPSNCNFKYENFYKKYLEVLNHSSRMLLLYET
jgi:xylan alpha-glucuronosyltransferase